MIRAALLAATLLWAGSFAAAPPASSTWQEVAWPFPRDAWPEGRAFRCGSASCGGEQEVYVRAKLGFCNCTGGVRDDAEVDGVSDLDMISAEFTPRATGEPIVAGGLVGRTRAYTLQFPDGTARPAAGFALSSRCDLVAVAAQGRDAGTAVSTQAVRGLLDSGPVRAWVGGLLGQRVARAF